MKYRNLVELHRLRAEELGPRPALRYKRNSLYSVLSWEDYRARAAQTGTPISFVLRINGL